MERIRLLIADDQRLFLEGLSTCLRNYAEDIDVVGLAADGEEALRLARELRPDVILMDVHMPRMDGVEATGAILEALPAVKILVLSTYDEDEYVRSALGRGASGYLLKDISPTELIASVRALKAGAVQISPQVVAKLMRSILAEEPSPERELAERLEWFGSLTPREREVFSLIAQGCDNAQIAGKLRLAEHTVRNLVSAIYSKLGVEDRFQIIQMANKIRYQA
ncbi:MAG TPA: response regulator transcription factor [Spirochaetales bacterium]|nr:response regulator transcription factor [Spirochaetales bacterium]HRY54159.1 response regulator transcription factor [Spirochaetia bacterium]HRZ65180.1 response regulator transcription factor [Spirochaetia bacterium]